MAAPKSSNNRRKSTPDPPAPPVRVHSVRASVQSFVDELDLDAFGDALAQVALSLAAFMDGDGEDEDRRSIATVAKELRATLEQLRPVKDEDDADWVDDAATTTGAAKVRNAKGSEPKDARPAARKGGGSVRAAAAPVAAARGGRRPRGG